nr:hypothetical protein [Tanacetum cinerariifolium]
MTHTASMKIDSNGTYNSFDCVLVHHIFYTYYLSVPRPVMGFGLSFLVYQGDTKQKVTAIKDVEDLQVRIENLKEIFSYLRKRKLKQKEVILGTDYETSLNDDTTSNDEISSNDASLRCSSSTPFSTRVKTKISNRKKTSVIHDKGDDRKKSLVIVGRKGKEKVTGDEGICSKGNKADVTIYKRAMVNRKSKMVEDVGAVKRGKERGVVIEDGGFSNDGGKETVVTKRPLEVEKWKEKV